MVSKSGQSDAFACKENEAENYRSTVASIEKLVSVTMETRRVSRTSWSKTLGTQTSFARFMCQLKRVTDLRKCETNVFVLRVTNSTKYGASVYLFIL